MEHEFEKKFDKCPCCGSEERFFEEMGKELKERGLAREEWDFHLDIRQGLVVDQQKEASIPIGSEVPKFGLVTDICLECGCVYAPVLVRTNSKKPPPLAVPPNRAQRRRGERGGSGLVGPFSTS